MKIDANSVFGRIQEVTETVVSKANEVKEKVESNVKDIEVQNVATKVAGREMQSVLHFSGNNTRTKLDNAISQLKNDASNVAYGAAEGFDAGKKSGEQAHRDTTAHGPKEIAGLAGGIAGSISGAIDGFNVGKSGGSSEDIRKKARTTAEFTGADAALKSMFLDYTESERLSYGAYKHYQANGGTMSYDEWIIETNKSHGVSSAPAHPPTGTSEDTRIPNPRPRTWTIPGH